MWKLAVPALLVTLTFSGCTVDLEAGQHETDTLNRSMRTVAVVRAHLTNIDEAVHAGHTAKATRGLHEVQKKLDDNVLFRSDDESPSEKFSGHLMETLQVLTDSYRREAKSGFRDRADAIAREHELRVAPESDFEEALGDADFDSYGLGTTERDDVKHMIDQYTKEFRERYEPGQRWPVPRWKSAQMKADANAKERSRGQNP